MEMFGKTKDEMPEELRSPTPVQPVQRVAAPPAAPSARKETVQDVSSISAGMTVTGKIAGAGAVQIFGRVQGELHASNVLVADGAEVEGDLVADELTVGGRVKGTIRAKRVKLVSTASVEGDIFHRSLAIEENARFEGTSRRDENIGEAQRVPFVRSQPAALAPTDSSRKLNGQPEKDAKPSPAAS
jgi:cytoskeletal protein CcmA (bactofilin family)